MFVADGLFVTFIFIWWVAKKPDKQAYSDSQTMRGSPWPHNGFHNGF
jgi:hypothetical protein